MIDFLRRLLTKTSIIHQYQNPAPDTRALIGVIDRFVDGCPRYDLEWDDFISWKNSNQQVESVRERINEHEKMLFSEIVSEKRLYRNIVINERNRIAALIGEKTREYLPDDWIPPTFEGFRK